MVEDLGTPGFQGYLNEHCVTLGQVLQSAGYFTAISGKWHVGWEHGAAPKDRGFTRSLNMSGKGGYYQDTPNLSWRLDGVALASGDPQIPAKWYTTDLCTDFAIRFIDQSLSEKKPFFLHLAYNAPHFPLQAPQEEIARFRGNYLAGWDALREQRLKKQIELGIVDPKVALSPRQDEVKAWDSLSETERDRFDHIMATYAATLTHMDTAIGRLVEALRSRGVLDNTVIFFLSDNGGSAEMGPEGLLEGKEPGSGTSSVYCGESWATLENTPFNMFKRYNHEGGVSTPLIVHWPAGITDAGALRRQVGHIIDFMPTCVELAGATYPKQFNGADISPMEGRSLVPVFTDAPISREALFWEHEGNAAVRVGDWKLVRLGMKGLWELYDLSTDRSEIHNLAALKPEKVKSLSAQWETWAKRAQVKPYPSKKWAGNRASNSSKKGE